MPELNSDRILLCEDQVKFGADITLVVNPELPSFKSTKEVLKEMESFSNLPAGIPVKVQESKMIRGNRWYKTNRGWINSLALAGKTVRVL